MDKGSWGRVSGGFSFRDSKANLTPRVILEALGVGGERERERRQLGSTSKPVWAGSRSEKEQWQAGTEPRGPLP